MFRRLGSLLGHIADKRLHTTMTALLGFLVFGGIEFAVHIMMVRLGMPQVLDTAVHAITCGTLFALLLWALLTALRERRSHVRKELDRIVLLNHEIRNALQIIADSQFDPAARHRDMVLSSVERIDVVLSRLFPARMD